MVNRNGPSQENPVNILVYDSGLGGFSVFQELLALYPNAHYTYLADNACFPIGNMADDKLKTRLVSLIGLALNNRAFDLCIIACNTASTIALSKLRASFSVPFVGTVPAIKPASALSQSRMISVLATPATVNRDYTRDLIENFAPDCHVTLIGAPHLANLIECELHGNRVSDQAIHEEIEAAFMKKGTKRTDVIVLGCTHFPLMLERFKSLAPWPVAWLDPAPAIARHAVSLLSETPLHKETKLLLKSTSPYVWPDIGGLIGQSLKNQTLILENGGVL